MIKWKACEYASWKTCGAYLRGCWMLFSGLFGTTAAGLKPWAAWCCSIDEPFWDGLEETTALSKGLFWFKPMISTGSLWAARSLCVVLCWTIRIPPAFTATTSFESRRRKMIAELWWVGFAGRKTSLVIKNTYRQEHGQPPSASIHRQTC